MKKILLTFLLAFSSSLLASLSAQIITTIAGNGFGAPTTGGYSGDGGQATDAELYYPNAVGFDGLGNMYIADEGNEMIRMVNPSGIISTVAGNKVAGYSGDGGPATAAEMFAPEGVWGDAVGNFYIADLVNRRIRLVNTSGIISTFAGNGQFGYTGDGGPATAAEIGSGYRVALDNANNVYICDQADNCVRKVNTSGIISTVAGNGTAGYSGDGGQATAAELMNPYGMTVDGVGNIYIADGANYRVRMVNTSGIITTIAGNGVVGFYGDGGPATAAELSGPFGVAVDPAGNVFIDDQGNDRIRLVTPLGVISTFAGNGVNAYSGDGGPATAAELYGPWDVSTDAVGNVYISDEENMRVRFIPAIPTNVPQLNSQSSVLIYPNPNKGIFTIQPSVANNQWSVEIYNLLGEKIYTKFSTFNSQLSIDISGHPKGVYLYRVTSENGSLIGSGRFVIE